MWTQIQIYYICYIHIYNIDKQTKLASLKLKKNPPNGKILKQSNYHSTRQTSTHCLSNN